METVSTRNAKNAVHASRDLSPVAEIIQAKFRQKSVNTVTSTTELAESVTKRYEIICHLISKNVLLLMLATKQAVLSQFKADCL